jgi:RNA polymerase sigma-70 factor (ECF subfamily)
VWRRCATFRGDSELLPWIRGILRHAILDRMKRPDREVAMERDGELDPEVRRSLAEGLAARPLAEEELRRGEREACFARCWRSFERAAPEHATVMAWIVEDGLDNRQIAEILGRTPGATREFISQCRKRARTHLAEWYALVAAPGNTA